ncbi:MAG: tetratricopeptide repeat protein [Alphaproteobacteria bacterium]|nr:MAG: tetratricopeptide repeat protein [Alphaproteobacteria bacterium]
MSDLHSDLLTQEVDEEVRRERMRKAWKAYRKYIFGTAIGIVILVAGREIYQYQVKVQEEAASNTFSEAMTTAADQGAEQFDTWKGAVENLDGSYKTLAELRLAAAAAEKGDVAEALAAYDAVAADTGADESMRDLATFLAGMLQVSKGDNAADARSRLSLVAVKGKPWYFSALEQLALLDLKAGNLESAHEKFSLLADDADSPQSIKARAGQFRSFVEARQTVAPATDAAPTSQDTEEEAPASEEPAQ